MDMLDTVINWAAYYGLAVQLQNSNDSGSVGENATFLFWLADRYKSQWNVWINPANELNGYNNGAADVHNAALWESTMETHVDAIRAAGFTNPICLDPPGWGERLDMVHTYLTTNPTFRDDLNLIIQPHYYPAAGQNDFRTDKLATANAQWVNYIGQHCILVGEVGIDNLAGRLDPNLDPAIGSVSLTDWANAQASVTDFLKWANEKTLMSTFSGVIGHMWQAYIPGMLKHDDNSMHRQDGVRTTWGSIYYSNYLTPPIFTPTPIGFPVLLGPKMGNGTVGTPDFQAEGKAGVRGAGAFITPNLSSPIVAFFNRASGAQIGGINGNGAGGVSYATTSDYRLKEDLAEITIEDIRAFFTKVNPVLATFKGTEIREPVLIAHEFAEVMPSAVFGEKDGEVMQGVDYTKPMPIVLAALSYLLAKES
jgi:hypothetical protein